MESIFLSAFFRVLLERIDSLPLFQCSLACGLEKDLKRLKDTLCTINAVLLDAEEQQATNDAVRDWLGKINDVAYDVDDVLDLVSTEALRREVEIHGSMLREVSNFLSLSNNPLAFCFKIGRKINQIREGLDEIEAERSRFIIIASQAIDLRIERSQIETNSFPDMRSIIGTDADKENIVSLLFGSSNDVDEGLSVIPIVGIGGIGKTTLAQLVYNDERVVSNFDLRVWVCVSFDYDIRRLLKEMIESATWASCEDLELSQLQRLFLDTCNAKKLLLVLDDVWNEDPLKWAEFKDLLTGLASGSKIIVTTRSTSTASLMGTYPPYMLRPLSNDDCLSMLLKYAFGKGNEQQHPQLAEIGKEIVAKCGGLPLAVEVLGGLLYMESDRRKWEQIRDRLWSLDQEDGILPALRLSYLDLPSNLKQCLAYCSIFPKSYEMGRESLINHWMAQGFLLPDGNMELEDIGNLYFNQLLSRSFFVEEAEMFDTKIYKCKMHESAHDLAQEVASTEWSEVGFKPKTISGRVRHVSFIGYDSKKEFPTSKKEFPTSLLGAQKLRSFHFSYEVGPINKSFVDTLINRFRCLRVLDLTDSQFEELPSFVCKLKHLRFLRLSWNQCLKALPNSICKLVNLQSLYLLDCEQLQDLPRDIGKLVSLRHLYLTSKLVRMPEKGLQCLTSLRSLVLSRCEHLASLSEGIQHLTSLRTLHISECRSLASLPSGMKKLSALEKLEIWNCEKLLLKDEDLQGLTELRSLALRELPELAALPQQLQQSAATLQYLRIENCGGLTTLPECLKDLTSLLRLRITYCASLMSLPDGVRCLTVLQQLHIRGCPNLSRSCEKEVGMDWPNIKHIHEIYLDSVKIK